MSDDIWGGGRDAKDERRIVEAEIGARRALGRIWWTMFWASLAARAVYDAAKALLYG